jgi:hypothetical protein
MAFSLLGCTAGADLSSLKPRRNNEIPRGALRESGRHVEKGGVVRNQASGNLPAGAVSIIV